MNDTICTKGEHKATDMHVSGPTVIGSRKHGSDMMICFVGPRDLTQACANEGMLDVFIDQATAIDLVRKVIGQLGPISAHDFAAILSARRTEG